MPGTTTRQEGPPHEQSTGNLDADFAPVWRPDPGDTLIGGVVGIGERAGQYDTYPIITVRQDDGTEFALHAFHTVAQNELAKAAPKMAERIGIKYLGQKDGQGGNRYHAYRVQVDRPQQGFNWGKYGAEMPDDPPESDIPSDFDTGYGKPPAPEPKAADDDSIPF